MQRIMRRRITGRIITGRRLTVRRIMHHRTMGCRLTMRHHHITGRHITHHLIMRRRNMERHNMGHRTTGLRNTMHLIMAIPLADVRATTRARNVRRIGRNVAGARRVVITAMNDELTTGEMLEMPETMTGGRPMVKAEVEAKGGKEAAREAKREAAIC